MTKYVDIYSSIDITCITCIFVIILNRLRYFAKALNSNI